jgi:L-aspartate semialdehyde sulfurtransferase
MRTIDEINDKILRQKAIVLTLSELKERVKEVGVTQAAK